MKEVILEDKNKDISLDEIKLFMNEFNLKLPKGYIDFISKQNGGYPSLSAFGNPNEDGVVIECFYCISLNEYDYYTNEIQILPSREIIQIHQIIEQNIPSDLYPFGYDTGGAKFCISTRDEEFGEIYMFYMDGTSEEPVYLCDSFEEFINNLEDLEIYSEEEDY
ncbi:MAG: SMI1/KNR4 family protein [Flavobacteriales bacterium]